MQTHRCAHAYFTSGVSIKRDNVKVISNHHSQSQRLLKNEDFKISRHSVTAEYSQILFQSDSLAQYLNVFIAKCILYV